MNTRDVNCSPLAAVITAASLIVALPASTADVVEHPGLTLEGAQRVAATARTFARDHGAPGGAVAVVDAGGQPIVLVRLDGTFAASADISIGKARTAVAFGRPTRDLEDTINKGRIAMTPVAAVTWFTPLKGGVPILVDGQLVGAIGVSGAASAQQDDEIATAGAGALGQPPTASGVTQVPAPAMTAAFAQGELGAQVATGPGFVVNASRREQSGEGEVHEHQTDIFYVISGRASVATGGELIGAHEVSPGEWRGSGLRGGEELQLETGSVLVVPRGLPHWFRAVQPPFRYVVVKHADAP